MANTKTQGFFFLGLLFLILSNRMAVQRIENSKPAPQMGHHPYPGGHTPMWAPHMGAPGDYNPWLHHPQTPRSRRHRMELDDASDTETDDGNGNGNGHAVFSRAIMPPQTPSRRSPVKERAGSPRKERERERSPVKFGRSPTKLYN